MKQGRSEGNPLGEPVRPAVRRIAEETPEGKVRDLLGRGYYEYQVEPGGTATATGPDA